MRFVQWVEETYDDLGMMRWVAFGLELIAGIALLGLMAVTCVDVVGRYFFSSPIEAATELTEIGIAVIVFAEMPVITLRNGHVAVDILDRFISPLVMKIFGTLSAVLISGAFYFLAFRIWELAARSMRRSETTEHLGVPVGVIIQYVAIMSWITAALMLTWGIYKLWSDSAEPSDIPVVMEEK
ncbi:TRAP transporter small permease [Thaumasiovibrio sp. DFM-14]|uniref:TRAP transporter small permease n=1 Tax=Thaumasiovibrio sp. DFM-14 TaxID=3384792 RepID=UPI0039A30905